MDTEAWSAAVHGVTDMTEKTELNWVRLNWTELQKHKYICIYIKLISKSFHSSWKSDEIGKLDAKNKTNIWNFIFY